MKQRGQDGQRRPGRLWRSPYGKRRARRHSVNDGRLTPTDDGPAGVRRPGEAPFPSSDGNGTPGNDAPER